VAVVPQGHFGYRAMRVALCDLFAGATRIANSQ
jgi:hypothetical protein